MLHSFLQYILLVIAILFLVMLAQRLKIAYPIVLVLGGLLLSFYPGVHVIFITFVVILLTLVAQGLTLPVVIKWVNMEDPDHLLPAEEQESEIRKRLAELSLQILDGQPPETVNIDKRLRLLEDQRSLLYTLNRKVETDEEVIRKYLFLLDLEEEKLQMRFKGERD